MRRPSAVAAIAAIVIVSGWSVADVSARQTKPAAQKPAKPEPKGEENDPPIPLAKVPQVVRDTLRQYAKDDEVKLATKGDADGTIVYEFDIEQGARKLEVSITPKGEFFGSEEVIALADVPEAARATISKLTQAGAKLVSVEKALDKTKVATYEAVIDKGGQKTEYAVNAAGRIVGTEKVPGK